MKLPISAVKAVCRGLARLPRTHKTILHLTVIAFIGWHLAHEGMAASDAGWLALSLISEVPGGSND